MGVYFKKFWEFFSSKFKFFQFLFIPLLLPPIVIIMVTKIILKITNSNFLFVNAGDGLDFDDFNMDFNLNLKDGLNFNIFILVIIVNFSV